MARFKTHFTDKAQYTLSYVNMRGVDFSSFGNTGKRTRYAYLENMYRDYDASGANVIESIPGFRRLTSFEGKIHNIYSHKSSDGTEYVVVHAGKRLYRFPISERDSLSPLSYIGTVEDTRSRGFVFGNDLYILDGKKITKVSENGKVSAAGDNTNARAYIPTTYVNGEEYEQRNLLTTFFYERYFLPVADEFAYGTPSLKYRIISQENKTCAVCGAESADITELHVPFYKTIGKEKYRVVKIDDKAFIENTFLTKVYASRACLTVGEYAFYGCTALSEVILVGTALLERGAFGGTTSLSRVYLGEAMEEFGEAVFSLSALRKLEYGGKSEDFSKIVNSSSLAEITPTFVSPYTKIRLEIPMFTPANELYSVKLNDKSITYQTLTKSNGTIIGLYFDTESAEDINGKEISILATSKDSASSKANVPDFLRENSTEKTPKEAVIGCTVCETFDGRVFLSGNPSFPNVVFYSGRDKDGRSDPLYFGSLNYFKDGTGSFGVRSMLSCGDSLAVFKSEDDGGGSIYYHTPKETGIDIIPKIYPVSYAHTGVSAVGEAYSFFDDSVFISRMGLSALEKQSINLERSISCRSHNVNARLLSEKLEDIFITKWCGYLVLAAGDRYYLADSRCTFTHPTNNREYEWYFLSGIGTYSDDYNKYVYSDTAPEGFYVHDTPYLEADRTRVFSTADKEGNVVYYEEIDGKGYAVNKTEERVGGIFSPSTCVYTTEDDLMLFGTESGDLCIFNNDKRGVAPPHVAGKEGFDAREYARQNNGKIHPFYYSFSSHAPRYALRTTPDDGGAPNLTKDTVKNSLAVKLRSFGTGEITFETGTEAGGYKEICDLPDSAFSFEEFDFSHLSFSNPEYITVPIREREKGWIEKDVCIYSDAYSSPFGVTSITYRFTVRGKIKKI